MIWFRCGETLCLLMVLPLSPNYSHPTWNLRWPTWKRFVCLQRDTLINNLCLTSKGSEQLRKVKWPTEISLKTWWQKKWESGVEQSRHISFSQSHKSGQLFLFFGGNDRFFFLGGGLRNIMDAHFPLLNDALSCFMAKIGEWIIVLPSLNTVTAPAPPKCLRSLERKDS